MLITHTLPLTSTRSTCARCVRSRLNAHTQDGMRVRSISNSAEKSASPRSVIFSSANIDINNQTRAASLKKRRRLASLDERSRYDGDAKKSHDPYIRMVSTPERMCIVTRQKLPWSFLVNLRPTRCTLPLPLATRENPHTSEPRIESLYLLPDRVDRPYRTKNGKGFWVTCHREVLDQLGGKGPHLGVLRSIPGITIHPNLSNIVQEQLCQRVIYELEKLERRLRTRIWKVGTIVNMDHQAIKKRVLRRPDDNSQAPMLNKGEEQDGLLPIALLDISNLSLDTTTTTTNTTANTSTGPTISAFAEDDKEKVDLPLVPLGDLQRIPTPVSIPVPTYDLGKLFSPTYHPRIKEVLDKILMAEEKYLTRIEMANSSSVFDNTSTFNGNGSLTKGRQSTLLLSSYPSPTADTDVSQNDVSKLSPRKRIPVDRGILGVDLAVALWRLRLFHGQGWQV